MEKMFFLGVGIAVGIAIGYSIAVLLIRYRNQRKLRARSFMPTAQFKTRIQGAKSWGEIRILIAEWRKGTCPYPSWSTVTEVYGYRPKDVRIIEQYALFQIGKRYNKILELERMIPGISDTVRKIVKGERIN